MSEKLWPGIKNYGLFLSAFTSLPYVQSTPAFHLPDAAAMRRCGLSKAWWNVTAKHLHASNMDYDSSIIQVGRTVYYDQIKSLKRIAENYAEDAAEFYATIANILLEEMEGEGRMLGERHTASDYKAKNTLGPGVLMRSWRSHSKLFACISVKLEEHEKSPHLF